MQHDPKDKKSSTGKTDIVKSFYCASSLLLLIDRRGRTDPEWKSRNSPEAVESKLEKPSLWKLRAMLPSQSSAKYTKYQRKMWTKSNLCMGIHCQQMEQRNMALHQTISQKKWELRRTDARFTIRTHNCSFGRLVFKCFTRENVQNFYRSPRTKGLLWRPTFF